METIRAVSRNHAICRAKRVRATVDGADFIYEEYIVLVADTMGLDNRISQKRVIKLITSKNVLSSNDYYVAHEYLEPLMILYMYMNL